MKEIQIFVKLSAVLKNSHDTKVLNQAKVSQILLSYHCKLVHPLTTFNAFWGTFVKSLSRKRNECQVEIVVINKPSMKTC